MFPLRQDSQPETLFQSRVSSPSKSAHRFSQKNAAMQGCNNNSPLAQLDFFYEGGISEYISPAFPIKFAKFFFT
jgi:hypothetical protein